MNIEQLITLILTPGTDQARAAAATCEALAQKMEHQTVSIEIFTAEEIVAWLRDCRDAMGGVS